MTNKEIKRFTWAGSWIFLLGGILSVFLTTDNTMLINCLLIALICRIFYELNKKA